MPECDEEALEREHPGVGERAQLLRVARHDAPGEPDVDLRAGPASTRPWPRTRRRLVVGGEALSGMSTMVVTPPAAAARVAVREALPLGTAGLVDVHVGVDQARHDHAVAHVFQGHAGRHERVLVDFSMTPAAQRMQAGRATPVARTTRELRSTRSTSQP